MKVYCDEVGSGSIFGPVLVAVVADNNIKPVQELKDSKAYTQKKREELYKKLAPNLIYSYGASNVKEIEELNIHHAKFQAFRRAVLKLSKRINISEVIVDGNFTIPDVDIPQQAIIKADEKFWHCSAASILAKVVRDNIIIKMENIFPNYSLSSNKGYYTIDHLFGVIKNGLTALHRKNFKYTQYCAYEREEFLKSKMNLDEFYQFVKNHKKDNGVSRYYEFVKNYHKWGEKRW